MELFDSVKNLKGSLLSFLLYSLGNSFFYHRPMEAKMEETLKILGKCRIFYYKMQEKRILSKNHDYLYHLMSLEELSYLYNS